MIYAFIFFFFLAPVRRNMFLIRWSRKKVFYGFPMEFVDEEKQKHENTSNLH